MFNLDIFFLNPHTSRAQIVNEKLAGTVEVTVEHWSSEGVIYVSRLSLPTLLARVVTAFRLPGQTGKLQVLDEVRGRPNSRHPKPPSGVFRISNQWNESGPF